MNCQLLGTVLGILIVMISPDEEKQRALKVSKLYGSHVEEKTEVTSEEHSDFPRSTLISQSILLVSPVVLMTVIISVYKNSSTTISEIQGVSIAFIAAIVVSAVLFIISAKNFLNRITEIITSGAFLCFLILIFEPPLVVLIASIIKPSLNDIFLAILNIGFLILCLYLLSILYILGISYILEKYDNHKRYAVAVILSMVPGIIYTLFIA